MSEQTKVRETVPVPVNGDGSPPDAGRELAIPRVPGWEALRRHPRFDMVALGALVLLLAFLWGRGRQTWYWLDEGIALGISSHPLSDIPALLRLDGSPPLYYLLLGAWMSLFGATESVTHLLSLLFALAMVPAAFWAGSSLFGRRAGWVAALLVAINPFLGAYANETRMYTLLALLSLLATATFLHAFVYRRRRYVPAFAVSLALLLYTHNWALLFTVGAGLALIACVVVQPDRRSTFIDGVLAFGAAGLVYAPWLPSLAYQVANTGAPFSPLPTLLQARAEVFNLLGGPEAVIVLGLGAGVALLTLLRPPWDRRAVALIVAATITVVTITVGWVLSRDGSIWVFRYLAVILGPILVFLAVGLAHGGRMAVASLALAAVLFAPIGVKTPPFHKSNVRDVAERVGPLLAPGDLVVTDFGRVPLLAFYLPPGLRYAETTGPVDDERTSDQRNALERLEQGRPEITVQRLLDDLEVGRQVLVACTPAKIPPPPDAPPFLNLVFFRCLETLAMIEQDDSFQLELTVDEVGESRHPVLGHLFTKTGP